MKEAYHVTVTKRITLLMPDTGKATVAEIIQWSLQVKHVDEYI